MHVICIGPFAQKTGYAQAFHDYMLALHRAGVSLKIVPIVECNTDNLDERYAELIPLAARRSEQPPTTVLVHTVPEHAPEFIKGIPKNVFTVAITTWETSEMPRSMKQALDAFDLIVVPSEFCANAMLGLGPKVRIVPHCFDTEHWPAPEVPPADDPFVFYSVLGWSERKNPIGLLKAYLSEFSADDNVMLRLKLSSFSPEDITALSQATNIPPEELPEIDIVTDYLDHDDMVDLHHESHVFVTAARGEGWNLPAFEAALLGNPVISPDWGGQLEYLDHYVGFVPILCQHTPVLSPPQPGEFIQGTSVRLVRQNAPSGISARQHWAEPNLWMLGKKMRRAYQQRRAKDLSSRPFFELAYGYDTIGAQFASLLNTKGQHA